MQANHQSMKWKQARSVCNSSLTWNFVFLKWKIKILLAWNVLKRLWVDWCGHCYDSVYNFDFLSISESTLLHIQRSSSDNFEWFNWWRNEQIWRTLDVIWNGKNFAVICECHFVWTKFFLRFSIWKFLSRKVFVISYKLDIHPSPLMLRYYQFNEQSLA